MLILNVNIRQRVTKLKRERLGRAHQRKGKWQSEIFIFNPKKEKFAKKLN